MVTAQNVQISSSASTVTNAAEAVSQQAPKVAASANNMMPTSMAHDGSNSQQVATHTTASSRPNNKRPSIDNAFFNSIARRRISSFSKNKRSPLIHSQSMPISEPAAMTAGHVLCSPRTSGSISDHSIPGEWMFNPLPFSHTRPDVSLIQSLNAAAHKKKLIYTRNAFLLTTIQSIIDLNNTAMECYRVGEYDSALEALREAESRRVRMEVWPSKPVSASANSMAVDNMASNHVELGHTKDKCSRSSYIYQRMDFDEGMHSHTNMEKMDGAEVIDFIPAEESFDGYATIDVQRTIVHTILLFNAGQAHRRRGEFDVAAAKYKRALKILREANMSRHKLLMPILHNIGQLQYRRGELATAVRTYEMALNHATVTVDGTVHVASALNCLGVLHYHANSSDNDDGNNSNSKEVIQDSSTSKAMALFQRALALRKQCLGPDHVDVATTLNNIGRIYVQNDQFDQALDYYQDALRIRRESLGTSSLDYAATAFNAGQSLHQKVTLTRPLSCMKNFLMLQS